VCRVWGRSCGACSDDLTFADEAQAELLWCRSLLQHSYAYAFFELAQGLKDLKDFLPPSHEPRLAAYVLVLLVKLAP
jgi:hypothetical protein